MLAVAQGLAQVMVEGQVTTRYVGQVGRDVAFANLDLAVLHVLRVDEQDVVDHVQFLQQDGADQTVEITAGHEAVLFGHEGSFKQ